MSYAQRIQKSRQKGYHHSVATKIRDMMGALRKSSNENRKRRWIWELLQNAKDAAFDDQDIVVNVEFKSTKTEGSLIFSHNGRPFSVDDVTFLVEQVSTKDQKREDGQRPKKTGKFGTGFLTTHLLSEEVRVRSVIKDPELDFHDFELLLDRTGRTVDEIIQSVESSLALLDTLDDKDPLNNFKPEALNTTFNYQLNEKGLVVASIGLKDLDYCIPYVLVLNQKFKEIFCKHSGISYRLAQDVENEGDDIKIHTIQKKVGETSSYVFIATISENLTTIAIEVKYVKGVIHFEEFNSSVPRLFCDFPLVGSEDFYFPVAINNPSFSPTEPRDGVDLGDGDDPDIVENKEIIQQAINLYYRLLDYSSEKGWQDIHVLADVSTPNERDWLSTSWFDSHVRDPIRRRLLTTRIVDLHNGTRSAIQDDDGDPIVYFPQAHDTQIREKIWELSVRLFPDHMPRFKGIHQWYKVLWPGCYKQTLLTLTKDVDSFQHVDTLSDRLTTDSTEAIAWLNDYYDLLNKEEKVISDVIKDVYKVIPNQNGALIKRSELYFDGNIDVTIKDALTILGNDPRDYLREKDVFTASKYKEAKEGQILHSTKKLSELIDEINKIIKEDTNEKISQVCDHLISLFSPDPDFPTCRQSIYDFSKVLFPDVTPEQVLIEHWDKAIWIESDKTQIRYLVSAISDCKGMETLMSKLNFSYDDSLTWLSNFVEFLSKNGYEGELNLRTLPILPNQNGVFCPKDDLFLDDGSIDDSLKEVSMELGCDFREELLEKSIFIELPETRTKDSTVVAEKINALIAPKLNEYPRSVETKSVCGKLFLWFAKNKELAERLFPDLFANKHRLYDDEAIAESMQRAEEFSEVMEEFGLSSVSDLRKALEIGKGRPTNGEHSQQELTQEVLASLGVTNEDELRVAFTDKDIAARFRHTSIPSLPMYQYAKRIIERAKKNIKAYLQEHPDYNCDGMEDIATTVLAGIKKAELPIVVVVRPSDNGEVIVYYTSEQDALDYANAELWIDNGRDVPKHLTLGRILKTNGINRIPV